MAGWFREEGLVSDSDAERLGRRERRQSALPADGRARHRAIRADELVLLDLWGKLDRPGAVFADITWMGYTGPTVPDRFAQGVRGGPRRARRGRRAGAAGARTPAGSCAAGKSTAPRRSVLHDAGYGDQILHRTGHSLGETVHGNGVNMDDYETHDDRRLLPGTGFTIEPGVYFDDFGVRTEINMIVGARDAAVTGPLQTEILALLA